MWPKHRKATISCWVRANVHGERQTTARRGLSARAWGWAACLARAHLLEWRTVYCHGQTHRLQLEAWPEHASAGRARQCLHWAGRTTTGHAWAHRATAQPAPNELIARRSTPARSANHQLDQPGMRLGPASSTLLCDDRSHRRRRRGGGPANAAVLELSRGPTRTPAARTNATSQARIAFQCPRQATA